MSTVKFQDLTVGQQFQSVGRTITEADITNFAGLSGDFNQLHTDEVWVRANTPFRGRIAHGLLIVAISSGLRAEIYDDISIQAYLSVERKMNQPVYAGDTVHAIHTIESLRESRSKPGNGIVVMSVSMLNQDGDVVQQGSDVFLVDGTATEKGA